MAPKPQKPSSLRTWSLPILPCWCLSLTSHLKSLPLRAPVAAIRKASLRAEYHPAGQSPGRAVAHGVCFSPLLFCLHLALCLPKDLPSRKWGRQVGHCFWASSLSV